MKIAITIKIVQILKDQNKFIIQFAKYQTQNDVNIKDEIFGQNQENITYDRHGMRGISLRFWKRDVGFNESQRDLYMWNQQRHGSDSVDHSVPVVLRHTLTLWHRLFLQIHVWTIGSRELCLANGFLLCLMALSLFAQTKVEKITQNDMCNIQWGVLSDKTLLGPRSKFPVMP